MTKPRLLGIVLLAGLALGLGLGCSSAGSDSSSNNSNNNIPATPPPSLDRLIEEGDIVWLDDPILYILNKTQGLSVVGLANPAAPLLIGRVGLVGTPVEIYLHNDYIWALTSNVANTAGTTGSRLSVVDVRHPEKPVLVGFVGLTGKSTNSRLVGDILYVASDSGQVVESVNLANPSSPSVVDRLSLPLGAYGSHVLATQNAFYVATESYRNTSSSTAMGECAASSYDSEGCTTILAVDISSPSGLLRRGASYSMSGLLQNRWGMDFYDGVLRVLLARGGWWTTNGKLTATLRTFTSPTANKLDPLGWLSLATEQLEKVMAVRFDGPRAYVVTFRQTDPLFTLDISNPASPRVAGHLQTPGWLDFIIPRGNRLLAIGRDQNVQTGAWQMHASLYDVSVMASPQLLVRSLFGDNYSALPDQSDNLAKVVRVIDELGLLLVPYNGSSAGYGSGTNNGHIEIFRFTPQSLTTLGRVASQDPVLRAVPLPPSHLAAVTESAVGVIQLDPELALAGSVDLNQPVTPTSVPPADGGSND